MSSTEREIQPTLVVKGAAYYNIGDSAKYTGLSISGFKYRIGRFNKEMKEKNEREIIKYQFRGEGRQRFFKQKDLDRLNELVPADAY